MDYKYILDKLDYISHSGTVLTSDGRYEPAWNVKRNTTINTNNTR